MTLALPHLPVLNEADDTRNWEVLQGYLNETPGGWTNPESFSAKLEATATCQVRVEQSGTTARLKGTVKAKEAIPVATSLFTLPKGFRPVELVRLVGQDLTTVTTVILKINATGVVENAQEIHINDLAGFDGITFNLT